MLPTIASAGLNRWIALPSLKSRIVSDDKIQKLILYWDEEPCLELKHTPASNTKIKFWLSNSMIFKRNFKIAFSTFCAVSVGLDLPGPGCGLPTYPLVPIPPYKPSAAGGAGGGGGGGRRELISDNWDTKGIWALLMSCESGMRWAEQGRYLCSLTHFWKIGLRKMIRGSLIFRFGPIFGQTPGMWD